MIPRRTMLRAGTFLLATGLSGSAYAVVIEPGFRLFVQRYNVTLPDWGARPPLTICITTDLHAGEPWMPLARVRHIVAAANATAPDLHVMLGDLPAHHRFVTAPVPMQAVAEALAELRAPLGTYAILGNHDWWDEPPGQRVRGHLPTIGRLLAQAGLTLLVNRATRLPHGPGVWLLGTDSMLAFGNRTRGADDLQAALAPLGADPAPAILLAHEPDLFPTVPARIGLTLSGHTHGGQVRLLGQSPIVPSRYGNRYAYGHILEQGRQLIVSGGLGCSLMPVRLGVPPELTVVRVSGDADTNAFHHSAANI